MAAFCVVGAVVVWPQWASCCGHVCCVAVVGVVMLCCLVGAVIVWLQWASHRVAVVGVVALHFVLRAP
jgi:hypothetical protein